ncbi:MAG: eL32 family ribosomal protein [Candidatus Pacearchaeota archaeon]
MKFLRRNTDRHSKLGSNRKKKQKWRRPTGRHNKMRDKKRGYPAVVSVGYRESSKVRGNVRDMKPVYVMNVRDVEKIGKGEIGIVGKVGMKKKMEIAKKAEEAKVMLYNLNVKKFLEENKMKGEKGK